MGVPKIHNQRGWDYLKKCRYSWQLPRPTHKKGDRQEQQGFSENWLLTVKIIQEQSPHVEIHVWFFDEHRVGLKAYIP